MLFGGDNWKRRLEKELVSLSSGDGYREVTYNRLKELVDPPSERLLAEAVSRKILEGRLRVFYRVLSPKKVAIEKFDNILDIPDQIVDVSTGQPIDVDRFRNVEAVYVSDRAAEH